MPIVARTGPATYRERAMWPHFYAYTRSFLDFAGRRAWSGVALVLAGAIVEGFGILTIIPLVALLSGAVDSDMARTLIGAMSALGLETTGERVAALTAVFILLLGIRNYIVWLRDVRLRTLSLAFVDGWRKATFAAMAEASWPTISAMSRTDLEHAVTNDVNRLAVGTDRILRSVASLAIIIVQLGIILVISPPLLLLVAAMIALAALFGRSLIARADLLGKRMTIAGRGMHHQLGQFMTGLKIAKIGNNERRFLDRFETAINDLRAQSIAFSSSQAAASGWFQFICGVLVCGVLLTGLYVLEAPLSVLAVTLVILARLVGPLLQITQSLQAMANMLPAFGSLRDTLAALKEGEREGARGVERNAAGAADPASANAVRADEAASLEVCGVHFRHEGQEEDVLCGASLAVGAGELAVLSGASGAGKTTLLDLVCGLIAPRQGELRVDGAPLAGEEQLAAWREQIGYLPQDPFLFDTTIRENLLWEGRDDSDEALWAALEHASAAQFVRQLPDGLDSRVGERGQALSGGERQRICIARALLKRPRLLILDEATSALDRTLEAAILARLAAMRDRMSILLITHRVESVPGADRRYRLECGYIVDDTAANI
ncbi:MAG: ABC transporter ATP-binding protein [Sphingomonadaceae bacterium]|nr:ABC transporter ATP-binding protein [Sphingomonadaceae bacterium]